MRVTAVTLLFAAALARAQQAPPQDTTFTSTVPLVVAPVSVMDTARRPIDGLAGNDFNLLVDGKPRVFDDEGAIPPIALVVVVETGPDSAAPLVKVSKTGSMIEPLIIGRRGRAAILTYDSEIRVLQEFTNDPYAIGRAYSRLSQRGGGARMLDAVSKAVAMLSSTLKDSRRVILLIGGSRDSGSESKLPDVLTDAQAANVSIFAVTWSAFLSGLAARPGETAPPGGMNLFALFSRIKQQGQESTAGVLTNYTGGRRLSFVKQDALEEAVAAIGEEIHSQYLLSFNPPPDESDGFHSIHVRLPRRPGAQVRTRPGYWRK
jgi:Ca-activated chloride channel family protein